jgi:hypothetical protein
MRVRVNESGKQSGVAEIEDFGAWGDLRGPTDGNDSPAGHDDEPRCGQRIIFAIKKASGFKDIAPFRGLLRLSVDTRAEEGETHGYKGDSPEHGWLLGFPAEDERQTVPCHPKKSRRSKKDRGKRAGISEEPSLSRISCPASSFWHSEPGQNPL